MKKWCIGNECACTSPWSNETKANIVAGTYNSRWWICVLTHTHTDTHTQNRKGGRWVRGREISKPNESAWPVSQRVWQHTH